jgi:hypothetical protein
MNGKLPPDCFNKLICMLTQLGVHKAWHLLQQPLRAGGTAAVNCDGGRRLLGSSGDVARQQRANGGWC